jgi:tetratricopeptide (TPR) repeat protein
MKSLMIAGVAAILGLALAAGACAEDQGQPGDAGKAGAPEASPPAPAGATAAPAVETPTAAAAKTTLEKAAAEIDAQVAAAEKLVKLFNDEMAKPDDKRDPRRINSLKLNAAQAYLRAAQKAKYYAPRFKDDARQSFLDQYETPNREKAIALLQELAAAAMEKKDYRNALALYNDILRLDPKNAAATGAIKKINEEIKTANGSNSVGGSTNKDDIKKFQQSYKRDWSGTHTDWGKTGRGSYW